MSPKDSPFGGKEATRTLEALVKKICSSMRAWDSLQSARLDAEKQNAEIRIDLILNPWDASMDAGNEFRCFVPPPSARGADATVQAMKLSAVSQYKWPFPFAHPHDFSVRGTAEAVVGWRAELAGGDEDIHAR